MFPIPEIKPLSEEEVMRENIINYHNSLEDQNNFKQWFPKINSCGIFDSKEVLIPATKMTDLPIEWYVWLQSENYSNEKIKEFGNYICESLNLEDGKKYFMKTGNFSNKFNFSDCIIDKLESVGVQFLDMFYASMCVGAMAQPTVVVREYIESDSLYKIYNGMPLRKEFRYFYDFDRMKIMGVSKYWNEGEMRKLVSSCDTVEVNEDVVREALRELKNSNNHSNVLKERLENYLTYCEFNVDYESYYQNNKERIGRILSKNIKKRTLQGQWSIDVMVEGDKLYLIDMAKAEQSALVEYMEEF